MAILYSLVNGKASSELSVTDRGLQYGDGLFETIAIVSKTPVFWEQHFQRLIKGCKVLGIPLPDESGIRKDIQTLCNKPQNNRAYVLKIIVTRGQSERGYKTVKNATPSIVLLLSDFPEYNPEYWRQGVSTTICRTQLSRHTQLAGIKHLNRLEQILARQEWDNEFQEGLMFDGGGNLIEGVMSNVFIVKDNEVITPLLNNAGVSGIMRQVVLNICQSAGILNSQQNISLDILKKADEVFLTNSLIGIWPVKSIDTMDYTTGKLTKKIMHILVNDYLVDYASTDL